jgi:hypothetical protein
MYDKPRFSKLKIVSAKRARKLRKLKRTTRPGIQVHRIDNLWMWNRADAIANPK